MNHPNTMHYTNNPSTNQPPLSLFAKVFNSLRKNPVNIYVIRQNPRTWPLIDRNNSGLTEQEPIKELADFYDLPDWIVAEILHTLQAIGYVQGANVEAGNDAPEVFKYDKMAREAFVSNYKHKTVVSEEELFHALHKFFSQLSKLSIIKTIKANTISKSKDNMPRGLLRSTSLMDMNYTTLKLDDLLNHWISQLVVWEVVDTTQGALINNCGASVVVSGGDPRGSINLPQKSINLGFVYPVCGKFAGEMTLKMIPGDSPLDLSFILCIKTYYLNVHTKEIKETTDQHNLLVHCAVRFSKEGIPYISIMQSTPHGLYEEHVDGKPTGRLISADEGYEWLEYTIDGKNGILKPIDQQFFPDIHTLFRDKTGSSYLATTPQTQTIPPNKYNPSHDLGILVLSLLKKLGYKTVGVIGFENTGWLVYHDGGNKQQAKNIYNNSYNKPFELLMNSEGLLDLNKLNLLLSARGMDEKTVSSIIDELLKSYPGLVGFKNNFEARLASVLGQ